MSANPYERYVQVSGGDVALDADLYVPASATALVAFVHGSGSNRYSPRNRYVAGVLQQAGLATLLFSLLTPEEEANDLITGNLRFDIGLLGRRLVGVTDWLRHDHSTRKLRIGYFGSSTGAAAALIAAAEKPVDVGAVVSRGGRPDLAGPALERVRAPTLLIVGGNDTTVLALNRRALALLKSEAEMVVIPGATHLFEEPGALERVAEQARDWFVKHLARPVSRQPEP